LARQSVEEFFLTREGRSVETALPPYLAVSALTHLPRPARLLVVAEEPNGDTRHRSVDAGRRSAALEQFRLRGGTRWCARPVSSCSTVVRSLASSVVPFCEESNYRRRC
jgi:hypothetical protein